MAEEGLLSQLKRIVVGQPIPSSLAHHERLSRVTGLAVLSSDALSWGGGGPDAILLVLIAGGSQALGHATPISLLISALLITVVFSYRHTIYAYPGGGGAYIVARENLGEMPALIAAASLLIDYVLTVSVSVAAGVAAITSAFPTLHADRVVLALAFIAAIMFGNLRGIRESGRIFAIPTYFFIVSILCLLALGAWRYATGSITPLETAAFPAGQTVATLSAFALLRAFADGCTAMTGVEAVADGVPAFRPPEARNAAATLITMAVLGVSMFVGITLLAHAYHVFPTEDETGVSQLARAIFGGRGVPYYLVQAATTLILVLAANTAYADFPRLASIVARDRFLPRQFMNQGDRLAFSNGIAALSALAAVLIIAFRGDTHRLLPLYMIGVFVSFTLSQLGMVLRWRRLRTPGWRTNALINGFGATVTGIVLIIVAVTKAGQGAWIIILLIPCLVWVFRTTHRHYSEVASQLTLRGYALQPRRRNLVLVPISGVQRAVVQALDYARSLSPDVRAIYVDVDKVATEQLLQDWHEWGQGAELVVLESPYRSVMEPLLEYIERAQSERPDGYITIVLPEFVPAHWWQHLLHNQRALLIKGALLFKPKTVVTSVPFHLAK